MSNEHPPKETFKEHQHELEKNVLAEKITTGWDKFKQGKLISYRVMALSLLAVTAVGLYLYIRSGKRTEASARWVAMESASSVEALADLAAKYPNTPVGNLANLHVARYKLADGGVNDLTTRDQARQKKAVENIESARDLFEQLVGAFKDDKVLRAESVLGRAKAEAALIGIYKEGNTGDYRGSPKVLGEWLDRLATEAAGTPWGEDAQKMAAALKGGAADELARVQRDLYRIDTLPSFPGGAGPKSPGDLPPLGGLSGIPGGEKKEPGPVAPPDKPKEPEKKDEKAKEPEKPKEPETRDAGPKPPEKK
jgi:hypothetical protein